MSTFIYGNSGRSFARSIAVVAAVTLTAYVAVALVRNTTWSSDNSAPFVRPVHAAESIPRDLLPTTLTGSSRRIEWSPSDAAQISQPRECDLAQGISTDCVFMD